MHLVPIIFLLGSLLCPLVLCEGEIYINYNQTEWEEVNNSGHFKLNIFNETSSLPGALKDTQYVEIIAQPKYNNQKLKITTNEVFVQHPKYLSFQFKETRPILAKHNVLVGHLIINSETHPDSYLLREGFAFYDKWTENNIYFPRNITNYRGKVTIVLENASSKTGSVGMLSRIKLHYDEETKKSDNQNDTKEGTEDSKSTLLYTRIMEENATTYPPDTVAWFNSSIMANDTFLTNLTDIPYNFNSTEWPTKFPDLWINGSRIIWPHNSTHSWFDNSTTRSPRTMPYWYNNTDTWYNTSRSARPYNSTYNWFDNSTTRSPRTMPYWYNNTDTWYNTSRSERPYNSTYNWFGNSTTRSPITMPYWYNYTTIAWRKTTAPPLNISKLIDGGRTLKLNLTASNLTLQNLSLHIEISKRNNEK